MAGNPEEGNIFDQMMEHVGGNEWTWNVLSSPSVGKRKAEDIVNDGSGDPVAMKDFVSAALRCTHGANPRGFIITKGVGRALFVLIISGW